MVRTVLYRSLKRTLHIALIFSIVSVWQTVRSQSVLLPGDVVTVSVNADGHVFDIVPLVDVDKGTRLYFSSGQWTEKDQQLNGGELGLTFDRAIKAGTVVRVSGSNDPRYSISGYLNWDRPDKRLFTYQLDQERYRFIYAVGWGEQRIWDMKADQGSDIPLSLSLKEKTLLELGKQKNYQYFLRNGASGTRKMILNMVSDPDHWISQDTTFSGFRTNFNILTPPVVQFERSVSRIGEDGEYASLNVAIFEHDGSRLTVDVNYDTLRSNAGNADIEAFRKATINFTGIIGNRLYEIQVPLKNDEEYEGVETAIFSLANLSDGNLGDYLTHSLIIEDNEIPAISLNEAIYEQGELKYLEIRNNEPVPVSLNKWRIGDDEMGVLLLRNEYIQPWATLRIVPENEENEYESDDLVISDDVFPELMAVSENLTIQDERGQQVLREDLRSYRSFTSEKKKSENRNIMNAGIAEGRSIVDENSGARTEATVSAVTRGQWYFMPAKAFEGAIASADLTFYFWDEREGRFKAYLDPEGSGAGVLMAYAEAGNEKQHEFLSGLTVPESLNKNPEWKLQASDRNEDGVINGTEGVNWLMQNTGTDQTAEKIISLLRQEGMSADPLIYALRTGPDGKVRYEELGPEQVISKGSPFMIRLTEKTDLVDVEINPEQIVEEPMAMEISGEKGSKLRLQVRQGNLSTEWVTHIDPVKEGSSPAYAAEPAFLIPGQDYLFAYTDLGGSAYREISISTDAMNDITLPLRLKTNREGEFILSVEEMNGLPEGWAVFLRDLKEGNEYTLRPDKKITFRIEGDDEEEVTDFRLPAAIPEKEDGERFELLFSPPLQTAVDEEETDGPQDLELFQNYPNPFNPITTISFFLPESAQVRLTVFNIVGQPVATLIQGSLSAGRKSVEWDATDMPSGMYLYKLEVGNRVMTSKMTLVK